MKPDLYRPLLCLALLALAGSTPASEAVRYMLEMELWIEGEHRDSPLLVVESGEPASITVDDAEGRSGWKIEVEVNPPGPAEGAPDGAIWIDFAIHQLEDGQWEHLADSMLGIHEGRTGKLSVADGSVQATAANSRVFLEVRASRLRPGEGAR